MAAVPRRPDPPPLQTNEFAPVIAADVLWLLGFLVLFSLRHHLAAQGRGWWVWVALSGFLLGLWGLSLMLLRVRSLRRAQSRSASASSNDESAGPRSSSVSR